MNKILAQYRNLKPVTIDALVSLIDQVLPRFIGPQERTKVTDVPTVRTIRYYISNGLVDKPIGSMGKTALYGYRHLLQLVVIKYLQTNNFQIKKIGEIIEGLNNDELEALLLPPGKDKAKERARDMASPLLAGILKSKLRIRASRPKDEEIFVAALYEPDVLAIQSRGLWKRIEVEAGLEIHIREDYSEKGRSQLDVLLSKIKHLLKQQLKNRKE